MEELSEALRRTVRGTDTSMNPSQALQSSFISRPAETAVSRKPDLRVFTPLLAH